MSELASALGSPAITAIRVQVPGFEPRLRALLEDEGDDLGAFQAMSEFARWLAIRSVESPRAPEVVRGFDAVEQLTTGQALPLASDLVAEFVEAIAADHPHAVQFLGVRTREFLR